MNIVYMHTHDSGRYFDPYGVAIHTPAIQGLAEQGVVFRQAFSAAPTCSPSRAALLTGMSPHSCGMLGLAHRGFSLRDYQEHAANLLNAEGYQTALCGIQHVADHAGRIGYREILGDRQFDMSMGFDFDSIDFDTSNASVAAQYIRQKATDSAPFFLSFGMFNTHRLFPAIDPAINPDYLAPPQHLAQTSENRKDFGGYVTSARAVDRCVATVMNALESAGLREQTIVVFTTDHGLPFPGMKCSLYDRGIGVTLIIDYPGNPLRGATTDALVSHLDILPTLCDMIGIDKPDRLEGESLLPLLDGRTTAIREEVFAEVTYHAAYEPMRCIRTDRYKLIRRFNPPFPVVRSNMDDCPAKTLLLESGFGTRQQEEYLLFDLRTDPLEQVNLAADHRHTDLLSKLDTRLENWMNATNDPLLNGPVPLPTGAYANQIDCISPGEEKYDYGD